MLLCYLPQTEARWPLDCDKHSSGQARGSPQQIAWTRAGTWAEHAQNHLQFPNVVVLNAVGRRNTQMSAKERKWAQKKRIRKSAKERKRAHKGTKERQSALKRARLETTRFETTRYGNSQIKDERKKVRDRKSALTFKHNPFGLHPRLLLLDLSAAMIWGRSLRFVYAVKAVRSDFWGVIQL